MKFWCLNETFAELLTMNESKIVSELKAETRSKII